MIQVWYCPPINPHRPPRSAAHTFGDNDEHDEPTSRTFIAASERPDDG